jgi:hypothetical protein
MRNPPVAEAGITVETWSLDSIPVDAERILRVHRYRDPDRVRPVIRRIAERAAADIAILARPEACFRRMRIRRNESGVLDLEGRLEPDVGPANFTCAAFPRLLAGCGEAIVFLLTLGPRVDQAVAERIAADQPVDALFLEAAGWLAVERATRRLAADLNRAIAAEGLGVTFRMGPGYDYRLDDGTRERWDLVEQAALFAVFGRAPLPVELLDSSVMQPKMSRSGLFAVATRN